MVGSTGALVHLRWFSFLKVKLAKPFKFFRQWLGDRWFERKSHGCGEMSRNSKKCSG